MPWKKCGKENIRCKVGRKQNLNHDGNLVVADVCITLVINTKGDTLRDVEAEMILSTPTM